MYKKQRLEPMCVRLRTARLSAGYISATKAIEHLHWKPSTYRAHENGQNNFNAKDAHKYSDAYGVSPSWLLFGEGNGPSINSPPPADRIKNKNNKNNKKNKHDNAKIIYACSLLLLEDEYNNYLLNKIIDCAENQLLKQKD
jgi:hypothetical protein